MQRARKWTEARWRDLHYIRYALRSDCLAHLIEQPLGSAMMSLQTIDRRLREEIADPLKRHLIQKTPPDYTRLLEVARPLGQDALKMGETVEHELIRLRATSAQSVKQINETATDPSYAPHKESSWQTSTPMNFGQHGSPNEDPHLVEEGKGGVWQNGQ